MKIYRLNGKDYSSEWALRSALPDVSFPNFTAENEKEVCDLLGVEIAEVEDKAPTEKELLLRRKIKRTQAVRSIVVEVDGMQFDGDETAQSRMARALKVAELNNMDKTAWVLADNTVVEVTKEQLEKALSMAMLQQGALWTKPYEEAE